MSSNLEASPRPSGGSARLSPAAWTLLALVLGLATALRLVHLDWDDGHAFHPDERAMAFAVERVSILDGRLDPDFFAYGSLPIYLVSIARDLSAATLGRAPDFRTVILLGRLLSVLAGVATVAALFLFGLRRSGLAVGAAAATLLALVPIHIQNSRFFAVDALLYLLTLLALWQIADLAEGGLRRRALVAGVLVGLACGTKISGASLLLPLAIAAWIGIGRKSGARAFVAALALAAGAAVASFLVVEPMFVTRFATVVASLAEQAAIARHAGSVPYTYQYLGTSPLLYPLEQLLLWGTGPVLGVTVLLAALWQVGRRSEIGIASRVLLTWLVAYLTFFAFLEVKYPRYLLPAVPLLLLGAAWTLVRLARRHPIGKIAAALVFSATLLQGLAFVRVFTQSHPAIRASEWLFEHAPDRSALLLPDWDEGLPLDLGPGARSKSFSPLNAPFYDRPDDGAKLGRLADLLEQADFVLFPTRRIYGSIARADDRFPATSALLANLFAGNLGFELVAAFDSRPRIFGFELPDELADESVTVYDHPRVLIFRRTEVLAAREIAERAREFPDPPWELEDFLRASPGAARAARPSSPWLRTVLLLGAVELLGLAAFALFGAGWRRPGAFAASRVLGVFAFAHLIWLAAILGRADFDARNARLLFVGLVALAIWVWLRSGRPLPERREWLWSSVAFYGFVALFLAARAWQPAIFWGEKPMDFGILRQLLRTDSLPPQDPWFAGAALNYSYFGQFVVATLGKLSGLGAPYLYNVAIALFAGLAASAAFASGLLLSRRIRTGLWSIALLLLLGNLSGLATWLRLRDLDFDLFWATSRIIPDTIDEYPFWSLLFADLHAHLLALPLVILFCGVAVGRLRSRQRPRASTSAVALRESLLAGWLLGLVAVTSSWSVLSLGLLAILAGLAAGLLAQRRGGAALTSWWRETLAPLGVVAATAALSSAPHWLRFRAPEGRLGVHLGPLATGAQIAQVFGLALLVCAPLLWALAGRGRSRAGARRMRSIGAAAAVLVAALVGSAFVVPARWGLLGLGALALAACFSRRARSWSPALAPFAAALALIAGAEFFFVWDRMNTVFKYHFDAWVFFGLAAAVVLGRVTTRRRGAILIGGTTAWHLWRAATAVALVLALTTSALAAIGALTAPRIAGPSGTLDGVAYLERSNPDESEALRFLNEAVPGSPAIVEAHGPSYGAFGRISMHTGLPTPVGWGYHLFQRAHPWSEIEERARRVATIYAAERRDEVCSALEALGVELVYFGELERAAYGAAGELRLDTWPELVQPVFRNSTVVIYRVSTRGAPCSSEVAPDRARGIEADPRIVASTELPEARLSEPRGVAAAADGFWVSDTGNHRLVKFDLERRPLLTLGQRGARAGELEQPCAVATTAAGQLLVADTWNHRLLRFDEQGALAAVIEGGFFGPRGLAVDPRTGDLLVADTGNHRVVRLTADGKWIQSIGGEGARAGEFREPTGVALSTDGRIAVADSSNGRIQILDAAGLWLATWEIPDWRRDASSEPDLVFATTGELWLTVPLAGEVRALDRNGALLARRKVPAAVDGALAIPAGIAWAPGGESLVVTTLDGRLVELPTRRASATAQDDHRSEAP